MEKKMIAKSLYVDDETICYQLYATLLHVNPIVWKYEHSTEQIKNL